MLWFLPLVIVAVAWFAISPSSAVIAAALTAIALAAITYVALAGTLWWATGAGEPVLVVDGDEIRARLRPAYRAAARAAGDAHWWDLRVAAADVVGVRLARTDRPFRQQLIAMDLPAEVAESLLRIPELENVTRRWLKRAGTPAAWPAPAMLAPGRRRAEVRRLIAVIEQARVRNG